MNTIARNIQLLYHQGQSLWREYFWTRPDNLWALKVAIAIALMIVPTIYIGEGFLGGTLALGAVGAALSETDDHPRGRLKTLLISILSFAIVSVSVELLRPYPILFVMGFALTAIFLILLGGVGYRYQGVTFGALLVSIYAMLGTGIKPWYYQPLLLPIGGIIYGSISVILLYLRPYRLIEEQLARSFHALSGYLSLKATLFLADEGKHSNIRAELAQKNIAIERSIDSTMQVLSSMREEIRQSGRPLSLLAPYYDRWLLLQQLHERATSSHYPYELMTQREELSLITEGIGKLLGEIATALRSYADSLLTEKPFSFPNSLLWTLHAIDQDAQNYRGLPQYATLDLLLHNLRRMALLLQDITHHSTQILIEQLPTPKVNIWQKIRGSLHSSDSRFRHAIRLSLCLVIGYALQYILQIPKGEWIVLTSLFVCQQSYKATRQRLMQRIMGTLLGVLFGVFLCQLLPTQTGQILLMLSAIYAFFYWLRKKYYVAVIFITIFVMASFNLQSGAGVSIIPYRVLSTLLGALLAFLVVRFIWPDWSYKHLPMLIENAIEANKTYLDSIYGGEVRGHSYYHYRRLAHRADNALAAAWQGMQSEPQSKRFLQKQAFALTYLNHSFLSYISAIGAHHYDKVLSPENREICIRISQLLGRCSTPKVIGEAEVAQLRDWLSELKQQTQTKHDPTLSLLYNTAYTAYDLLRKIQSA